MPRPPGSYNLKESARQKTVRLLASGKTKEDIKTELTNDGCKPTTVRQYLFYATKQLTGAKINEEEQQAG